MTSQPMSANDLTTSLQAADFTTGVGINVIMPRVYDEIRRIAQVQMNQERANHTLSATAVANEAYLKLIDQTRASYHNKQHFMAIAARAIRRILVDHARAKNRIKRGGGEQPMQLDTNAILKTDDTLDLLGLDDALQKFEAIDPEKARVVELRFFGEMSERDIAELLNLSERTVRRYWQFARAWLYRELSGDR